MNAVVLLLAGLLQTGSPVASGTLTVCTFDHTRTPVPGVEVFASAGADAKQFGITRPDGCLDVQLGAGTYRITGRLVGFQNATRDDVVVAAGAGQRAELYFSISPLCDCVHIDPPRSLAGALRRADAVIHGRIVAGDMARDDAYRHVATVLDILKPTKDGGPYGTTISVLDLQYTGAPVPIHRGAEFVIFAPWNAQENAFVGFGRGCCGELPTAFLVRDSRIGSAPAMLSRYAGMPLDAFLAEVRRAVRGR